MRLAVLLACLPLTAQAGANPEALYKLIHGTWAETPAACATEETWDFAEGSVIIHGDGGTTCGFDRPGTDGGLDIVLDLLCPIPGEEMAASTRRIGLNLDSPNPGLADPADRLTVIEGEESTTLQRCPTGN